MVIARPNLNDVIDPAWGDALTDIANKAGWGLMGYSVINVDQAGVGATLADLTGFSIAFTALPGRVYKATWRIAASQLTAIGNQFLKVSDGATDMGFVMIRSAASVGVSTLTGSYLAINWTAGAHTLKLRATTDAGSITIANASQVNGLFMVEDVGPV